MNFTDKKIKVGIIGATGYAGVELVRIILRHPFAALSAVSSVSFEGKNICEVYPSLGEVTDIVCETAADVIERSDVVFAALPHGLSQKAAHETISKGKKFIDLGADFRLDDEELYKKWYDGEFEDSELHKQAVYGLPELFRADIVKTSLVANPGCYPTSVALGLSPALKGGYASGTGVIIDSKSGVTGAGRGLSDGTHYPAANEAFSAYKVASHRHTPEIEQTLSKAFGAPASIVFVPHLLPVNRGIFSTIYAKLTGDFTLEEIRNHYIEFYKNEQFVRVMPKGVGVDISHVRCSNYCDIQLYLDENSSTLIITSVIDNMVKGASGQAVQNMNLIFGLPESAGIDMIPTAF